MGNGFRDAITGCASSILVGYLQSCSWRTGLLFELVQPLGYVIPGSVCEEHFDDSPQFGTRSGRIQLLHDAVNIGKEVRDNIGKLGLTLSCKATLLAHDKSLEKLIVGHLAADGVPICEGKAATDLEIEIAAMITRRKIRNLLWRMILVARIQQRALISATICSVLEAG